MNKILKAFTLVAVVAYSGLVAAKPRDPSPELGLAIKSQGDLALVAIREESRLVLLKPAKPARPSRQLVEYAPAGGASSAATQRCAE